MAVAGLACLAWLCVVRIPPVQAAWVLGGNPICLQDGNQRYAQIVSDGAGGAIIVWEDNRTVDWEWRLYAQRISATGDVLWSNNGVFVRGMSGTSYFHQIVADGSGGAMITWRQSGPPDYDVYAQRIDMNGNLLWGGASNCPLVCEAIDAQDLPQIAAGGGTGSIITWQDHRNGVDYDIYAQRLDLGGKWSWNVGGNGIAVCTAGNSQLYPKVISDDAYGAIIVWQDYRKGNPDIYAQRLRRNGGTLWGYNGVAVCTSTVSRRPQIVSDGASGAIVTWSDMRGGVYDDIYAQRVDSLGNPLWIANGVTVCTAADQQSSYQIVSDGIGGAIIAWQDYRNGNSDIYAQRVGGLGNSMWTADGVPVCVAPSTQSNPQLASDGLGGAVIVWQDARSGSYDLYAQHLDPMGGMAWTVNGVAMCTASYSQDYPSVASDGAAGALIAWNDRRSGNNYDIYATRTPPEGPTDLVFASATPVGTAGCVTLTWNVTAQASATSFIVLRSDSPEGEFTVLDIPVIEGRGDSYSCRDCSVVSGRTYWYKIALVAASGEETYGPIEVHVETVPTLHHLYQNYPNPFNPGCLIRYDTPCAGTVRLLVYDAHGRVVRTLVDSWKEQGTYSETWDGRADDGRVLPSGVYFYKLEADDFASVRKMIFLK